MIAVRWATEADDVTALGAVHATMPADAPSAAHAQSSTLVALDGDDLLGAGTLVSSARHPDIRLARIDVAAPARRRGVGSALLHAMTSSTTLPLLFNAEVGDNVAGFLAHHGYGMVVESRTVLVDVEAALRRIAPPKSLPAGLRIGEQPEMTGDIAELYDEIYAVAHSWAGRYAPPEDIPWIGLVGDVVAGFVGVAKMHGVPVGVTSLHGGPFAEGAGAFIPPTALLGEFAESDQVGVLGALLRSALGAANEAGISTVNIEYDTPPYAAMAQVVGSLDGQVVIHRQAWMLP